MRAHAPDIVIITMISAIALSYGAFVMLHSGAHRAALRRVRSLLVPLYLLVKGAYVTFDPNDPAQRAPLYRTEDGPHELGAFARMAAEGWPVREITQMFRTTVTHVMANVRLALEVKDKALKEGRGLHDKPAPKGAK